MRAAGLIHTHRGILQLYPGIEMIDRGAAFEAGRAPGDRLASLTGGSRGPRWRGVGETRQANLKLRLVDLLW